MFILNVLLDGCKSCFVIDSFRFIRIYYYLVLNKMFQCNKLKKYIKRYYTTVKKYVGIQRDQNNYF